MTENVATVDQKELIQKCKNSQKMDDSVVQVMKSDINIFYDILVPPIRWSIHQLVSSIQLLYFDIRILKTNFGH